VCSPDGYGGYHCPSPTHSSTGVPATLPVTGPPVATCGVAAVTLLAVGVLVLVLRRRAGGAGR
jgi:hypothetical protein